MSAGTKKVGVLPRNFDWANWITAEARNGSPARPLQAVRSASFERLVKTSQINLIHQQGRPMENSFCPEALRSSKAMLSEVAEGTFLSNWGCSGFLKVWDEALLNPTVGCPDQSSNCRIGTEWNSGQPKTSGHKYITCCHQRWMQVNGAVFKISAKEEIRAVFLLRGECEYSQ